ncbi:DNA (cytosine-5-)-methyltransferase [Mucilaginibacter terrigena]|uniref:DNA (cytosine-5-)-methyltransferase n=1 Tax=Mucilaginibacter terrigena TaxID=2492395 RepID=A0A4Q5LJ95_9SPHI|nr:DNA (cytosine-5-)-methyltransferase [Mucilaginibacter terrigena]RYU89365.1 DNA (cytosine-5-)-methyltransferase [Mucilaginibacter terrigena]
MIKNIFKKNVVEFFAGIGLMRLGLEKANWNVTFANDIDPIKEKLYKNNFNNFEDHFCLEDIHLLKPEAIPTSALATASFPCTDLSLAGRRAGLNGQHSSAFWGFINILKGMGKRKPPLVLLENVAGFLTSNEGNDFKDALTALNKLGYSVDAFIINAANFVPQSRVRLFVVGKFVNQLTKDTFKVREYFPETDFRPTKLVKFIYNNPEINWDINHGLAPLPQLGNTIESIVENVDSNSDTWWNAQRVEYFLNQTSNAHLSKLLNLKRGNDYTYLTAFRRVRNGRSMAEIRFDGIAGCLRTPKGGSARQILLQVGKDEVNIRLLNPKECARLMGADDFNISGTLNEALFGFGDAVCVPVITWIANNYLNQALTQVINLKEQSVKGIEKYAKLA